MLERQIAGDVRGGRANGRGCGLAGWDSVGRAGEKGDNRILRDEFGGVRGVGRFQFEGQ